jgi:hypothetical protein
MTQQAPPPEGIRVSTTPIPDWLPDVAEKAKSLRCTRKPDRAAMAALLSRLAAHYGARIELEERPTEVSISIHLNAAFVGIFLDGLEARSRHSRKDGVIYMGHWNIESDSEKKFDRYFESLVGSINTYHWRKATSVVCGFDYFLLRLAIAFGSIQDGTAFEGIGVVWQSVASSPYTGKPIAVIRRNVK